MKEKKSDVLWVKPEVLQVEKGFNVRVDYGDIDGLADSILENGIKVPLHVKKKKGSTEVYIITDGHRRFKAVEKIVADQFEILVPVMVERSSESIEERTLGLITYNDGKPLTLLEEAEVYRRLSNFGWSATDISKRVGKSPTHINNCFVLNTASTKMKKEVASGKISASAVIEALKKGTNADVEKELVSVISKTKGKVTPRHLSKNTENRGHKLTVANLQGLYENLDAGDGERVDAAFTTLENIIKWAEGRITNIELSESFFNHETDD